MVVVEEDLPEEEKPDTKPPEPPKVEPVTVGGVNFTSENADPSQEISVTDAFISALNNMSNQARGELLAKVLPDIIGQRKFHVNEPVEPQKRDFKARYVRPKDRDWGSKSYSKNLALANGRIITFKTNQWQRVSEDDYRFLSRKDHWGFFETAAPWDETPEDFLPRTKEIWAKSKEEAEERKRKEERDRKIKELQQHLMGSSRPEDRDKFFQVLMQSAQIID